MRNISQNTFILPVIQENVTENKTVFSKETWPTGSANSGISVNTTYIEQNGVCQGILVPTSNGWKTLFTQELGVMDC